MKIYCIQQVFFEGPSIIKNWAENRQLDFEIIHLYEKFSLPKIEEVDGLVILGGPMSIHDEEQHPWLVDEKQFIKNCMAADILILGICLGAQLLANCLGAAVYPNKYKEIGWLPITLNEEGESLDLFDCLPKNFKTFQWHGDTFDLPKGAQLLASSEACRNQAFKYKNVLGLQFHPEMVSDRIEILAEHCSMELQEANEDNGKYIQTKNELLAKTYVQQNNDWLMSILDQFFK